MLILRFIIFALSVQSINAFATEWPLRIVAKETSFKPRDSSANMIAKHDGHIWILGGWSNFGRDDWHSYVDVWRSLDGVKWEEVNKEPPFDPYSKITVFDDKLWAFDSNAWSTKDGKSWKLEAERVFPLGPGSKMQFFKNRIYALGGARVAASNDGITWGVIDKAPWPEKKKNQNFLSYKDELWVFGGEEKYGAPDMVLYNDVWVSEDGSNWTLVNENAKWLPRIWASSVVYDDKIFLFNGWNKNFNHEYEGNFSEIWMTSNGVDWVRLLSPIQMENRHASFITLDENGNVLISSGYGGRGISTMYNDVWKFVGRVYFSKKDGSLSDLGSWGKETDGTGASPNSFDIPNQIFVLNNRDVYEIDPSFSVSGNGSYVYLNEAVGNESIVLTGVGKQIAMCQYKNTRFENIKKRKINWLECL